MSQPANDPPEGLEICQDYAAYDPIGIVSLEKFVSLVGNTIRFARQHRIRRLLINARELSGFPSPSVAERYFIVRKWAAESETLVEVALVLQRYMIDPERFGVQVAINLGMRANVFDSRSEALIWLLGPDQPQPFGGLTSDEPLI